MPSSKGKPTDPKLREKVKEDIKNETNKDGGGKGQWSAWKVFVSLFVTSTYPPLTGLPFTARAACVFFKRSWRGGTDCA
jgi:hypothetical protein